MVSSRMIGFFSLDGFFLLRKKVAEGNCKGGAFLVQNVDGN